LNTQYLRTALVAICLVFSGGCVDKSSTPQQVEFDYVEMLANYADNVIVPTYKTFEEQTSRFKAVDGPLEGYCVAIGSSQEDQTLDAANPELLKWQKRLSAAMLKKGVILKDMRRHLVFTLKGPDD